MTAVCSTGKIWSLPGLRALRWSNLGAPEIRGESVRPSQKAYKCSWLAESEPSAWAMAAATAVAAKRRTTLTLSAWCVEAYSQAVVSDRKVAVRAAGRLSKIDATAAEIRRPTDQILSAPGPKQASCSRCFCLLSTECLRFCPSSKHTRLAIFSKFLPFSNQNNKRHQ